IQQRAILWTSEEITAAPGISYQTLGRLYYHNGYLYAGVWAMAGRGSSEGVNSTGVFFCVRAKDGVTVWQYQDTSHPAGYYWNQAVSCHDRLYFMSEDGALISHGLTDTKVYETRSLTDEGQVRCGLIASEDGRYLYTVAKNGTLIRITLAADGTIGIVDTICLIANPKEGKWIGSTSTPALWKNRLYVGCSYDGYGVLCVIDTDTFRPIYAAKGPKNGEVKSRPLLIPDPDKPDTVYIYVTANEKNGALYVLTDTTDTKEGTLTTLFTPYSAKQYCLANAVSGEDNTVYYSNDSGTLFAIADTYVSADEPKEVQKKKKKEIDALNKGLHAYLLKLLLP
ncbi:MAG: hypothetical protein VZQ83_10050, partial [Eubacterium sp.]|nr:hypothetical protein [Eubacterium sp.]